MVVGAQVKASPLLFWIILARGSCAQRPARSVLGDRMYGQRQLGLVEGAGGKDALKRPLLVSLQLLKEKLRECYLREGVNHLQNCREVRNLELKQSRRKGKRSGFWDFN